MKGELGLRWIRAFPIDSFLSCSSIRLDKVRKSITLLVESDDSLKYLWIAFLKLNCSIEMSIWIPIYDLTDSLSLVKRLKQIKDETESKVTTRGELLSHLTSLEKLLNKNPKSKGKIKPLIRRVSIKLSKLS